MPLKALYVDDDNDICQIAQMCLEIEGTFEACSVNGGREALEVAESWQPDVILLDVMMPGMDGPTTLSNLKENPKTSGIPVIFITAKTLDSDLETLKKNDILGVLAKPFQALTLSAEIVALMEGWS